MDSMKINYEAMPNTGDEKNNIITFDINYKTMSFLY